MSFPTLEAKPQVDLSTSPGPFKTGSDVADRGSLCERDPAKGKCVLEPAQRSRLIQETGEWMNTSLANYHAALLDTRMELLLQKDSGWDFATELIVGALSSVLIGGLGPIAAKFARRLAAGGASSDSMNPANFEAAVKAYQSLFVGSVKQFVTAAKIPLKARLAGYTKQVAARIQFITELQDSASAVFTEIVKQGKLGDDSDLILTHATLDPGRLTVSAFREQIDDALARYTANHLDQLGSTKTGPVTDGERKVVRFANGRETRLAVIEVRERKLLGRSRGDEWYTSGGTRFLNWVDDDLADAAMSAQSGQGSGNVETIDLSNDSTWMHVPAVWSWQFGGAR